MDILLVHAYFLREDPKEREVMRPYPPLGLLYLSSHLKSRGFQVGVFDGTFQTREDFLQVLRTQRPSVVGFSCNLMTKLTALALIRDARATGARVVVGGPDPPYYAEEYLASGAEVVVAGEGEQTLEELLPCLLRKGAGDLNRVRGLVFRGEGGEAVRTPSRPLIGDLDAQPLPDREAVDIPAYLRAWRERHGFGSVSLICSRGCPYTCNWCSRSVFGETHRRRTPGGVAREVAKIVEDYRPDQMWYADDVFTIHKRWLVEYSKELSDIGLKVPFECISRADKLDEEVIRILAGMGCRRLWIGSESGSQRILDAMDRRVTVEKVRAMTRLLKSHDIQSGMFIMLGYEGEEEEDLQATVDHLKAAMPDTFLTTVAYPIRGTPYYTRVEDRIIQDGTWANRTDRDLEVRGRRPRRYYAFASQWMAGEVGLHRLREGKEWDLLGWIRGRIKVWVGRWGMRLTS